MSEELKPCPLCAVDLEFFGHDKRNGVVVDVYRHPTPENPSWDECPLSGQIYDVERWNKRPIEDALQQKYDLLLSGIQKAVEKIEKEHRETLFTNTGDAIVYRVGLSDALNIIRKHIKEVKE